MPPLFMTLAGFALLGLFAFGGHVQGRGEPAYVASAARAFLVPWLVLALGNLWVRWSAGAVVAQEALWLPAVAGLPIAAAFAVWRHYRAR